MRSIIRAVAGLATAVLLAGGAAVALAPAAGASTGPARYTHDMAGYQTGSAAENWRFRYIQGTFYVSPGSAGHIAQVAELTTSGDPSSQLLGTNHNPATDAGVLGVTWIGGSHVAAYACPTGSGSGGFGSPTLATLLDGNGNPIAIHGGDLFTITAYYDAGTNTIHYSFADHNPADPGSLEVQCSVFSGDIFHGAALADVFLQYLNSDTGETVTTWTRTGITTYSGIHGTDGLKGGWQTSQVIDGDQGASAWLRPTPLIGAAFSLYAEQPH
jgi:hypothetical protein